MKRRPPHLAIDLALSTAPTAMQDAPPRPRLDLGRVLMRILGYPAAPVGIDQRAAAVHQWLKSHDLFEVARTRPKQRLRPLYGEDPVSSSLLARPGAHIGRDLRWLDPKTTRFLREMLIDRAHAECAQPELIEPILLDAVRAFFALHSAGKYTRKADMQRLVGRFSGHALTLLRSQHVGEVYYQQSFAQHSCDRGAWFVGLSRHAAPVAVTKISKHAPILPACSDEPSARRGDYLVRHETDAHVYFVTPLYPAVLPNVATLFVDDADAHLAGFGQKAFVGARYLCRESLRAMHRYHHTRRLPHGLIRAAAICVDVKRQRLVLVHAAAGPAELLLAQDAQSHGSRGACTAARLAGLAASRQSDVVDVSAMVTRLMLSHAPSVARAWTRRYPNKRMPKFLFGDDDLRFAQLTFDMWLREKPAARTAAIAQAPQLAHVPASIKAALCTHFDRIDAVMHDVDARLWDVLQMGLRGQAFDMLEACALGAASDTAQAFCASDPDFPSTSRMTPEASDSPGSSCFLGASDKRAAAAIWQRMPTFSRSICDDLVRLHEDVQRTASDVDQASRLAD